MSRSLTEDLNNPYLFEEHTPGTYEYTTNAVGGRSASGQVQHTAEPQRDSSAQRSAGGDLRRDSDNAWGVDDGGHLIGARFGGSPTDENLTAQDRNLNRGAYKRMENEWDRHLSNGDKVFVNVETSQGERPDAYMGYAIYEHADGTRDYDVFSYVNESQDAQQEWQDELEQYEAQGYRADELSDYKGTAGNGGTFEGMDQSERESFAAAWDEQLVTPTEGIDDSMDRT